MSQQRQTRSQTSGGNRLNYAELHSTGNRVEIQPQQQNNQSATIDDVTEGLASLNVDSSDEEPQAPQAPQALQAPQPQPQADVELQANVAPHSDLVPQAIVAPQAVVAPQALVS